MALTNSTLLDVDRPVTASPTRTSSRPERPLRVFVLNNIPTPSNDALFGHLASEPDVVLRVAYCAAREPNRVWVLPAAKRYDHVILPGSSLGGWVHINPSILRELSAFGPDVVVLSGSYHMPTLHASALYLRAKGIPWVYWGEELQHGATTLARRLARAVLRWPIRLGRGVLAIGRRAMSSYERAGVPPRRIANFLYYADASSFRNAGAARDAHRARLRARCGIGLAEPVFLFCGQMIHRKGVDTLLEATTLLASRGLPGRVVLVGDGPERNRFEALATTLGVDDRVSFAGFVQPSELPEWFAASDVLVLPSRSEGWGLVVSEAFACGVPVLATEAVNAAVELVEEGRTGWIVPTADPHALGEVMCDIAASPATLEPMRQAVQAASLRVEPSAAAPRLVALLRAVSAGKELAEC